MVTTTLFVDADRYSGDLLCFLPADSSQENYIGQNVRT